MRKGEEAAAGRLSGRLIMMEEKKPLRDSITLSHDTLKKYFPKSYTPAQIENTIFKLLDSWLRKRQREESR